MNPRTDSRTAVVGPRWDRSSVLWVRCVLAIPILVVTLSGVVSAHVPSAGASVGFRFPILVGGSALIGSIGGIVVVTYRSRSVAAWLTDRRFVGTIGIGLSGLAGLVLFPIVATRPLLSVGSVLVGIFGATVLSATGDGGFGRLEIVSTTGALTLHQVVEGAVLAGAYVTGGVVGVVAALVLTLHTVAETATVAATYATVGQYKRGAAVVVFMQGVYVVAAGLAFVAAWSVPALAGDLIAAVVAGVLLVVGLHESWSAVRKPLGEIVPFGASGDDDAGVEDRSG